MPVRYTEAFKRQLKRLARRCRHIRTYVEPVIQSLQAGEAPGDRGQGVGHSLYKVVSSGTRCSGKRPCSVRRDEVDDFRNDMMAIVEVTV